MKVSTAAFEKLMTKRLANKVIKKALSQNNQSKLFKCKKCGEGFLSRSFLMKHKCQTVELGPMTGEAKEPEPEKLDIEKQKKDLKCSKCIGIAFPNEEALKHHKILHSGFKPYSCNVCNITFENEGKWQNHVEQSAKQSHCDECLQFFGCLIAKQRHVCLECDYFCVHCGAQFKKSTALDRHVEKCKLQMECRECGKKFVKKGSYKIHMKQMHDIAINDFTTSTPLPPKEAPNIFTTIGNFIKQGQEKQESSLQIESETIHLNGPVSSVVMCSVVPTPNGNKYLNKSECEFCHKVFRNFRGKVVHRRVHMGANSFRGNNSENFFTSHCETCKTLTKFITEIVTDCAVCQVSPCICENVKPKFSCSECSCKYTKVVNEDTICKHCREIFDDETTLNEHLKTHVLDKVDENRPNRKRTYNCTKCKASLKSLVASRTHRKVCKARRFEAQKNGGCEICCLQCEKILRNKLALDVHLKICGTSNGESEGLEGNSELKRLKTTLNESALNAGNTSIECNKCMKIFRTPKHLETHDKLVHKDYQCKVCNLMFWKSEDLLNHFRIHNNAKQYKCDYCESSFDASMKLRYHRVTHFSTTHTEDDNDVSTTWYKCEHCDLAFDSFRKFELHCKRFAIGPDGKIKVLPKRVRNKNTIKRLRSDVQAGLHVEICLNCQQTFEDEQSLEEHKATCEMEKNEIVSSTTHDQAENEDSNMENGRETPINDTDPPNCQNSPSIFGGSVFGDVRYEDDDGEDMDADNFKDQSEWLEKFSDGNDPDSVFHSTVELIENSAKDEPITSDSNLVYLAVKVMDICIHSRGTKRAPVRVRKIIKDVFKLLVDYPVRIERPHSCYVCDKLFIHPQGITNHYYRKHGARGILHSLSKLKNKELPETVEKKPRKRQRRLSALEVDEDMVGSAQVENNVSPKDEPILLELRNNISKLLCHLVSDNDVLAELGWPQRLIDDVLIDVIGRCESRPCLDARKSRLSRLRENIMTLLSICIKDQAMVNFGWNSKPVDEVVKEMLAGTEIASA